MTGLLVHWLAVPGHGAIPAVGVEGALAAQHGEREPMRAVPGRNQGHQRWLAAGDELVAVADEVRVVQTYTTA